MVDGALRGSRQGPRLRRAPERAGLVLLGIVGAEALVGAALLQGWLPAAGLLHAGICALLLPLLRRLDPPPAGWPGAALRVTAAALPALGPLAALAGLLALAFGPPRLGQAFGPALDNASGSAPLPEDPMESRLAAIAAPTLAGAPPLPAGLLLEALGDVLRWGTPPQKARALDLLAYGGRRGGDALLHLALLDPDPALRARAEAARPAAERRLIDRAAALHEAARVADPRHRRALARHLDAAAFSGLLDPARAAQFRVEASGLWQGIVELAPDDAEAQSALGRDLLVLGDLPAARAALEAALARGVATPGVLGWLAECLFRLRDFAALEALISRWRPVLEAEQAEPGVLAPAWRLWLEAGQ